MYTHTACTRVCIYIYIYGAAVINLRSKITYGPQMLRSVFLRFPLFIHPPLVLTVECREKTHARRLYAPILYTHTHTAEGWLYTYYVVYIHTAAVAGALLQENRQYFCRAKNGGGGSKTMWTPLLLAPSLPPRPGPAASSTRSDGAFPLAGLPDGYARATPPRRDPYVYAARRHRSRLPARGLLMFLGRRLHTYYTSSEARNTCYTYIITYYYYIMTVSVWRSFRIFFIRPSSTDFLLVVPSRSLSRRRGAQMMR